MSGTNGILELPKGYLTRLSEECKKRGIVLIVDEAQTGIGCQITFGQLQNAAARKNRLDDEGSQ
jgi:acetylornithine/succinyldiaminopimelate/putrescine aminotransferase